MRLKMSLAVGVIAATLSANSATGRPHFVQVAEAAASRSASTDTRTDKQKALAQQTEVLFDMATELKAQVDKTNKNILSMKVVEKAEQIEQMARAMKDQARKQ